MRDEELLETLEALIQDLAALGWHIAVAVATPDAAGTRMWLSRNALVTCSLSEMLREKAYTELLEGVDSDDTC